MKNKKIVILATPGGSTNIVYNALRQEFTIAKVILEKPVDKKNFLKRRIRSLGIGTVIGQLLFKFLVIPVLERKAAGRIMEIKSNGNLLDQSVDDSLIFHVETVNAAETIEALQQIKPDVIVVNGTRIISKKVLQAIDAPFINTHAGITPLYRGVHGGYWALANEDSEHCGVTVHLVDSGIDTGSILYQALISPNKADNFVTYPLLQLQAGLPLLKQAVADAMSSNLKNIAAPAGNSQLWSHPTIFQYLANRVVRQVN